jgi:hypothetical protein
VTAEREICSKTVKILKFKEDLLKNCENAEV